MNKVDELIKDVEDVREKFEAARQKQIREVYGVAIGEIEKALREGLGEEWVRELAGDRGWEKVARGEVTQVLRENNGTMVYVALTVAADATGKGARLAKLVFRTMACGFGDGSVRTNEVLGSVGSGNNQSYVMPVQLGSLLTEARQMWLRGYVDDLKTSLDRPWLFGQPHPQPLSTSGEGSDSIDRAMEEGMRLFGLLMELAPEDEENHLKRFGGWEKFWMGEWDKRLKEAVWKAAKPGLLAEYEAAYGEWLRGEWEVRETQRRMWAELQDAVDEAYGVWQLTFGAVVMDEGGQHEGIFDRVWALAPEADWEGYWPVVVMDEEYGQRVIRRRRFYNLVAIDEGIVVRPTGGHETALSIYSDCFEGYLACPPGMGEEVRALLAEVEGELEEIRKGVGERPVVPEGDWDELDEVRRRVEEGRATRSEGVEDGKELVGRPYEEDGIGDQDDGGSDE